MDRIMASSPSVIPHEDRTLMGDAFPCCVQAVVEAVNWPSHFDGRPLPVFLVYKRTVSPSPNFHLVVLLNLIHKLILPPQTQHHPQTNTINMSFHVTAEDARIEVRGNRTILFARLRREDGEWNDASYELDQIIGNNDGKESKLSFILSIFQTVSNAVPLFFRSLPVGWSELHRDRRGYPLPPQGGCRRAAHSPCQAP